MNYTNINIWEVITETDNSINAIKILESLDDIESTNKDINLEEEY